MTVVPLHRTASARPRACNIPDPAALSDAELLAVLVESRSGRPSIPNARRLLRDGLLPLVRTAIDGGNLPHHVTRRLRAAVELTRRAHAAFPDPATGAVDVEVLGRALSHDKSCSLGLTIGYKVFVCDNLAFHGDFSPVMRKHTSRVDIQDVMALAVDRMQRHFEPMQRQVDAWRGYELPDDRARLIIYRAFIEDGLDAAKHLARVVHQQYFEPEHEEFRARTLWSLSNAFTSAFKKLDPIPAFNATAKLGPFIEQFH